MLKGRRVGTLTAGVTMVLFGVLLLLRYVIPGLDYRFVFCLWPVVLILLGAEIILSYLLNREDKLKYDGGAVFLILLLTFFCMIMAGAEFIIRNAPQLKTLCW